MYILIIILYIWVILLYRYTNTSVITKMKIEDKGDSDWYLYDVDEYSYGASVQII